MAEEKIAEHLMELAVDMNTIAPDPANARQHPARNLDAIRGSLLAYGQQKPVVVDGRGVILAGSGLYQAARQLGWERIAAVRTGLAGIDGVGYSIADNRTAELAEWDWETLAVQLAELQTGGTDLEALGFSAEELAELLAPAGTEGLTDEDAVPAPPDEATTKPGDLWILGNHRLLCGDSAKAADVDRLLEGAPVHLVNTDPPYNVKVEPRSNNAIAAGMTSFSRREDLQCERSTTERGAQDRERLAKRRAKGGETADAHRGLMHHQAFDVARQGVKRATTEKLRPKDRPLINDFMSDEAFEKILHAWFGNIARVLVPGRCFYIWGGYANLGNYPPVLKACELYFSQGIVWDKEWPVLTRKDFMGAFEICFYGWREGAGHKFFGPSNATDLWHIKKIPPPQMQHLTEKPVELARRAVEYSSRPGENVLDLFGGAGGTLIAAEKTGRRCFLMELDALYCDVIVQRWEQFTGKKAERQGPP